MALNDRPHLYLSILLGLAVGLLGVDAFGLGYPDWVYVVMLALGILAFFLFVNWCVFQYHTSELWANTAKSGRFAEMGRLIQAVATMDSKRFEGFVFILALFYGDEADRPEAISQLKGVTEEMKLAADMAQRNWREGGWYASDAINYAKQHNGLLPVLRDVKAGEGSRERNRLEELYEELKAVGVARGSAGHQARIVGQQFDKAMEIAKRLEARQ